MKRIVISTLLCSMLLASCSKKIEEHSAEAVQENTADTQVDMQEAAEPNTLPVQEQKPEVILNQEVNPVELTRRMVREAQVNFTVKDVVKSSLEIEKITLEAGGFIERKDIDFNVVDLKRQNISEGKVKVFEKVEPVSFMVLRVPSERAPHVVNQLLPLMFFLNQQRYSAQRFELKLLQEKMNQAQTISSQARPAHLNEITRLTQLEVQDRVKFSTISLQLNQPTLVRERVDIDIDAVARLNGDHFIQRAWNSIKYGWQFVLDLLVFLLMIWPLYLIVLIGFLLYRWLKPYFDKLK